LPGNPRPFQKGRTKLNTRNANEPAKSHTAHNKPENKHQKKI